MPNRITDLTTLATLDNADLFEVVDVSDTTMSANGTNKKVTSSVIASLLDNSYVNVSGDSMTGPLSITDSTSSVILTLTQNAAWTGSNYALSVTGYSYLGGLRINVADVANGIYGGATQMGFSVDDGQRITFSSFPTYLNALTVLDGKVGIGQNSPGFPLNFASAVGDKISFYGTSGSIYGIGVQSSLLQIYADASGSDIAFGHGSSGSFTERARIKGSGDILNTGYLRVGSTSAPNNTTAGDLTAVRLSIGNTTFSTTAGEYVNFGGTMTDTTTGAKVFANVSATINSASDPNSGAEFRTLNMSAGIANTATNYPTVMGINTESRQSGTGNITQARGIASVGVTLANSSYAGTVTDSIAILATSVSVSGTPGGTITTATGVKVGNANMGSSTTAITTLIGVDIVAQTKGATNIGIRIPAPSGGATANYALQLSDTGGTAAGGITFGTDTVLYRDAANSLTTVDKVLITPDSNPTLSLAVSPTVTQTATNARGIETKVTFNGASDGPAGLGSQPLFNPNGTYSNAYGLLNIAKGDPSVGNAITSLHGGLYRTDTGNGAGTIANANSVIIATSSLGSLIPSTMRGVLLQAIYPSATSSGTTNVIGIDLNGQRGGTSITECLRIQYPLAGTGVGNVTNCHAITLIGATYTLGDQTATTTSQHGINIGIPTYQSTTNTRTITNSASLYINGAPVASTNVTITNGPYSIWVDSGTTRLDGRLSLAQGADVGSANDLTLGSDGNTFEITGTTQINAITATGWTTGSIVVLIFTSTPTVKHNTAGGANTAVLLLAGAADFAATAGDTLTLVYSEQGGTNAWREIGRAVI